MRKVKIAIDKYLLEAFKALSNKRFTVVQVRDAYLRELSVSISPDEARKLVYRQLLRLTKAGVLVKERAKNVQNTTYMPSPHFKSFQFALKTPKHQKLDSETYANESLSSPPREHFEDQLRQYQVDLLSSIGESEEYKRLYTSNPELKTLLESQYRKARDESSRILGQIKAIKNVISYLT